MRVWSTDGLSARERFSFWNDAVCDAFLKVRTECETRATFRGEISCTSAGGLMINHVVSQAHTVRRSRTGIAADINDSFFINLHRDGACVLTQNGRRHAPAPGQFSLHDSTRPFDLHFPTDMALTCFIVPRAALLARAADAPCAIAMPLPEDGAGRLFGNFARTLAATAASLTPADAEQAGLIFVDLLALTLGASRANVETARTSTRNAMFQQICRYVRAHLGNPALTLAGTAAAAGVAPRTLQTLFHEHGTTFTDHLLEQRLLLADRQLTSGSRATITEIAYALGFSDLSYFSRVYRRRFGATARERRARTSN